MPFGDAVVSFWHTAFEKPLYYLGLGANVPASQRFIVAGALTGGVIYLAKPNAFFTKDGTMKEWSLISDDPNATPVPAWLIPVFVGAAVVLFV